MTDRLTREQIEALLTGTTPGPWKADAVDPSDVVVWGHEDDQFIANIGHRMQPVSVAFDCDGANARLIAAAPDLARTALDALAEVERLREALTPSEDTKAAYMGKFSIPFPIWDEDGNEKLLHPNVPWTTIKDIMSAIRARAALEGKQ